MYRYSAQKNKQANQKFQQKQLNKKIAKKSSPKRRKTAESAPTRYKSPKTAKKAEKRSLIVSEGVVAGLKALGSVLVVLALAGATLLIGYNSFLPQFFGLEEEVNLLLVGAAIDERATNLYLVKVLPETSTVTVLALAGGELVPVMGGYGKYPLGSLAAFLNFEKNNLAEVRSAYNFSLKQVIDEVYFIPGLQPISSKKQLQGEIWRLMKEELGRTTKIRPEVLDLYFGVKESQYFAVREVGKIDEEVGAGTSLVAAKDKLVNCPVVLINAAGVNGLARKISQMVEMNGFSVVNWETSSEIAGQSRIDYDQNEPECLQVVQAVQQIFPKIGEINPDGGEEARKNRAKAVIVLGPEISD